MIYPTLLTHMWRSTWCRGSGRRRRPAWWRIQGIQGKWEFCFGRIQWEPENSGIERRPQSNIYVYFMLLQSKYFYYFNNHFSNWNCLCKHQNWYVSVLETKSRLPMLQFSGFHCAFFFLKNQLVAIAFPFFLPKKTEFFRYKRKK